MASSDNENYNSAAAADQSTSDDDESYQNASDDGGLGFSDEDYFEESSSDEDPVDHEKGPADETNEARLTRLKGYALEVEDDVRKRQEDVMAKISELLVVPPSIAAVLLRHCKWDAEQLEMEWFSDEKRIRDAVGLTVEGGVPTVLNDRPLTCGICFDPCSPGEMRSAGCSHYYCHECWRGYIRAAVGDGQRCLSLRCPDPRCSVAVVQELVGEVAADEEKQRYAMFAVRSYVEEGKNMHIRWCPGPGCTLAVNSLIGLQLYEVSCACKHVFCFRCGEEAHRPASCEMARKWIAKNSSDGETMNWVLVNTKHCPRCRRPIEKNMGCMHMTCSAPCGHQFCWLCLGPWDEHRNNYSCNRYSQEKAEGTFTEANARRKQAKASLDRYLHYYERWTANGASRKKAREDLDYLVEGDGLDAFAATMGVPSSKQIDFLGDAYAQIVESRRVLRWTYAYVYFLEKERDKAKRDFCEYLQSEAEASLERLHHCAEREREALCYAASAASAADKFAEYRITLVNLTGVTQNYFNQLVKGFETGMAEVLV